MLKVKKLFLHPEATVILVSLLVGRVTGSNPDVQKELSQQMEQISEQHQKQLTTLREEIRGKETQMETFKEYVT